MIAFAPVILCDTVLDVSDIDAVETVSEALGISKEEVVRLAVHNFCAECVPTHSVPETISGIARHVLNKTSASNFFPNVYPHMNTLSTSVNK